jgi:hypothetical protein
MDRGYVKLWRKTLDSGWFQNPELFTFWCYCLCKATWKPITQIVGFQQIDLQPGQFVFGRRAASAEIMMSVRKIRTCMQNLKNMGNVTLKTTNKFTIISVVNWDIYQIDEIQNGPQSGPRQAHKRPTGDHKQEVKNIRIKEYSLDFLSFYNSYPKKSGRDDAWRAWQKRNGDRPQVETLLDAIKKQTDWRSSARSGEFRPEWKNPATWISKGCWSDEIPADSSRFARPEYRIPEPILPDIPEKLTDADRELGKQRARLLIKSIKNL